MTSATEVLNTFLASTIPHYIVAIAAKKPLDAMFLSINFY